jgi:hypothetical protein
MDFAAALYSFLTTNSTVTAAVGTRSHHIELPQGATLPALVYREMFTDYLHAMGTDDALEQPSYEIEVHADTATAATTAINAVISALQNYSGAMGSVTCQAVLISGGAEDKDPDTGKFWKSKEFEFFVL